MNRRILLIISGGIAAFKSLELIRWLGKNGIACRCILTRGGAQFVTPLSVAALSGDKVYQELFSLTDEAEMGHIELSRSADLVVVCPASADLLAKAAHGHANDLATTALLATDKRVLFVPAMNVRMWQHPATQRNITQLRADGAEVLDPDEGLMACGEFGPGRLPEVERIGAALLQSLSRDSLAGPGHCAASALPLAGQKVILTAGPTVEALDPVRFISNRSSGKQGYAIAAALARLGAETVLVSGPTALAAPKGVTRIDVESAREMLAAVESQLPAAAFVAVAAVADWRPEQPQSLKIKKAADQGPPALSLVENPDILRHVAQAGPHRPRLVVGFAAETHDVEALATAKLARKGCDWIVANDVSGDVMGGERNEVAILSPSGIERLPPLHKDQVGEAIAQRIADALTQNLR